MSWNSFVTCHSPLVTLCVARSQRNHAFRAGQNFLRVNALFGIAFEPRHFTVFIFGEPVLKLLRACGRSSAGETAVVEAQFQRALSDFFFHHRLAVARRNWWTICCATSRTE